MCDSPESLILRRSVCLFHRLPIEHLCSRCDMWTRGDGQDGGEVGRGDPRSSLKSGKDSWKKWQTPESTSTSLCPGTAAMGMEREGRTQDISKRGGNRMWTLVACDEQGQRRGRWRPRVLDWAEMEGNAPWWDRGHGEKWFEGVTTSSRLC